MGTQGIHHVTAISGDPARTVKFYADTLGLRLVKRTVNFDDPGTWHLYFGDRTGRPGTILTFFPWPGGRPGRVGTGQAAVTSLAIPPGSVGFWLERLGAHGVEWQSPELRFGERVLPLRDPDGMLLELVATERGTATEGWDGAPGVPADHAIRGVHGVTLWTDGPAPQTERVLTGPLGFAEGTEADGRRRFIAGGGLGGVVDLRRTDGFWRGAGGVGTVHHVAFRAADDVAQGRLAEVLQEAGQWPTPVQERQYFRSIYFREPGGVLFEVATDRPGFVTDEDEASLGTALKLPPWLEPHRDEIARVLPPLGGEALVGEGA